MFYNARQMSDGRELRGDVCIIGAGAAGITIAREMIGAGFRVFLVESGGFELDPEVQELYDGKLAGRDYGRLDATRLRYFGGTTNHWTGWTRPLDAIDFEQREWVANSGWPFGREELDPWYNRAERILELGDHSYESRYWEELFQEKLFVNEGNIETGIVRHSPPTRFGKRYREELHRAENVHVILHGNLVDWELNSEGDRVTSARLATLEGTSFHVRARCFVLATGGVENARLLLTSRDRHENGLGNSNGLVGRYFADHSGDTLGTLSAESDLLSASNYTNHWYSGDQAKRQAIITPGLLMSESLQRQYELPNFGGILLPYFPDREEQPKWGRISAPPSHRLFDFRAGLEPQPPVSSRVSLSEEKDALGMPQPVLNWKQNPDHQKVVDKVAARFATEFAKAGLGRMKLDLDGREKADLERGLPGYGSHHMGTTRMSENPSEGVVNANCRMHELDNLYIAGSSVFPTFGFAQPTFTIVALALRLADHLLQSMKREDQT